jgi:hypothetical protein
MFSEKNRMTIKIATLPTNSSTANTINSYPTTLNNQLVSFIDRFTPIQPLNNPHHIKLKTLFFSFFGSMKISAKQKKESK